MKRVPPEGLWQGFDGEWGHVSKQLIDLAEAMPAEQYGWRPAPGIKSVGEVYNHITLASLYLLSITGPPLPADFRPDLETAVTDKAQVIEWLKRSIEAVRSAHQGIQPAELQRDVKVLGRDAKVDGMYLRIIVHANEHMGQLVGYARMMGVTPPWA